MRIALCSTFVPFLYGGARNIVEWLEQKLLEAGHDVERIYLPQVDVPDLLFQQMMAFRWIDLDAADRIICFRPQAHLIPHRHKILWFIHHVRVFYDLWESPYRGFPDDAKHRGIRSALISADTAGLLEAKRIFTNSKVVSGRLKQFNGIESEVLYPPVYQSDRFQCRGYNDEIVYVCRIEHHKRQHLLIEAMAYTLTPVKLRVCGTGTSDEYIAGLVALISSRGLQSRVSLENKWISEDEKVGFLADCLAAAYLPLDEDSYGYPSVEASHASKAVLTTLDSGGVLELVADGVNGYVSEPTPQALAGAMDKLFLDRRNTIAMGKNAKARLEDMNIDWDHVLKRLLE